MNIKRNALYGCLGAVGVSALCGGFGLGYMAEKRLHPQVANPVPVAAPAIVYPALPLPTLSGPIDPCIHNVSISTGYSFYLHELSPNCHQDDLLPALTKALSNGYPIYLTQVGQDETGNRKLEDSTLALDPQCNTSLSKVQTQIVYTGGPDQNMASIRSVEDAMNGRDFNMVLSVFDPTLNRIVLVVYTSGGDIQNEMFPPDKKIEDVVVPCDVILDKFKGFVDLTNGVAYYIPTYDGVGSYRHPHPDHNLPQFDPYK